MALMLDVPLTTQETLMNYIGGLRTYIHNILFMLGHANLDEVYVQETYIESGKTEVSVSGKTSSNKYGKGKVIRIIFGTK
jgi:hypothetical protein